MTVNYILQRILRWKCIVPWDFKLIIKCEKKFFSGLNFSVTEVWPSRKNYSLLLALFTQARTSITHLSSKIFLAAFVMGQVQLHWCRSSPFLCCFVPWKEVSVFFLLAYSSIEGKKDERRTHKKFTVCNLHINFLLNLHTPGVSVVCV